MNATRYTIEERTAAHGPEIVLRDLEAKTTAIVLPQAGFNCYRFTLNSEVPVEFIAGPVNADQLKTGSSGFGWPILFPFPNRIAKGEFTFNSKTYRVPVHPKMGHAIHGFVLDRPWRVSGTKIDPTTGASVTGVISSEFDQALQQHWPWPCRLTVTYRLQGLQLIMSATAENLGKEPMPFGFGVHPYHPLPLTAAGKRERCMIQVPCRETLELRPDCIPTGRRQPVTAWQQPEALGTTLLDTVFSDTKLDSKGSACLLRDPDSNYEVSLHADAGMAHWVVYAPQRPVVCFEPYTCVTDAFNLKARGEANTGFAVLEPGKPWTGVVTMAVRKM